MVRSSIVTRSRYVEDQLVQAIERGVAQYVILGRRTRFVCVSPIRPGQRPAGVRSRSSRHPGLEANAPSRIERGDAT
jgi:hypothetical protein